MMIKGQTVIATAIALYLWYDWCWSAKLADNWVKA